MNLLTFYKEKHLIDKWKTSMSSSGANQMGSMYNFYNTNFRNLNRYLKAVTDFEPYEGKSRDFWPKQKSGQEKFKHYVRFLTSSKLYRYSNRKYYLTRKGSILKEMLSREFSSDEQWILTFLLFLDAYYDKTPNYFVSETGDIVSNMPTEINLSVILESFEKFLKSKTTPRDTCYFEMDAIYYHAFYADKNLLKQFNRAPNMEKNRLKNYVKTNYLNSRYNDVISLKLKPKGTVQPRTVRDEILTFYLSVKLIENLKLNSIQQSVSNVLDLYNDLFEIDITKIKDFMNEFNEIFEAIYSNYSKDYFGVMDIEYFVEEDSLYLDGPEAWIDSTTIQGISQINSIFEKRKSIAKESANYTCFFEEIERCSYFTSRTEKENYVEVHHLVPREYRNDFEHSIEVLENYIVLCPTCHKKVHLALCNERRHMINYMFEKRKDQLERKGIKTNYKELLEMYKCY